MMKRKPVRPLLSLFLSVFMIFGLLPTAASAAGTADSDNASNVFIYVGDSSSDAVLLKVIPLETLEAMAHGPDRDDPTSHYGQTYIDSYPCPTYKEGVGVTIPELLEYVKSNSAVASADKIDYKQSDKLYFTCTDGAIANYTYKQLLGVDRYAYPDFANYWDREEESFTNVDAVMNTKVETEVYLATSSAGGRIPEYASNPSTGKLSIASKIAANGGELMGCLKNDLSSDEALTLCFGQTDSDIENAAKTYGNVKKWVYMLRLKEVTTENPITSLGTVAAPTCDFTLDGSTLTITLSCETEGASIYYSTIGGSTTAPLNLYTGPIVIEDYDASKPFTLGYQAVQEGWVSSAKQEKLSSDITEPEDAPAFTFSLTGSTSAEAGSACAYGISLVSDRDCPLYGAEYRLAFPTESFEISSVSNLADGWEYGIGSDGEKTTVTFTYLDQAGAYSLTAGSALDIASLNLRPVKAGSAAIDVSSAIVARQNATAYQDVTAEGLSVSITDTAAVTGDIDGDGKLTAKDMLLLGKYLRGDRELTESQLAIADLNADGKVSAKDLLAMGKLLRNAG